MAGDWFKFEHDTLDKPEILAISEQTGDSIPEVIYRLLQLWRLADRHTDDGVLRGIGPRSLAARLGGTLEFWESVAAVGWLKFENDNSIIPHFAEVFGASAKRRMSEAKRKQGEYYAEKKRRKSPQPCVGNAAGNAEGNAYPESESESESESPSESITKLDDVVVRIKAQCFQWARVEGKFREFLNALYDNPCSITNDDGEFLLCLAVLAVEVFSPEWIGPRELKAARAKPKKIGYLRTTAVNRCCEWEGLCTKDSTFEYFNGVHRVIKAEVGRYFREHRNRLVPERPTITRASDLETVLVNPASPDEVFNHRQNLDRRKEAKKRLEAKRSNHSPPTPFLRQPSPTPEGGIP